MQLQPNRASKAKCNGQTETITASLTPAWRLRHQHRWKEAADFCRSVLSLNPNSGEAWHLLGLLAHDQGDHERAAKHIDKAISVEPGQPIHYNNFGVVCISMQRYEDAAIYLDKALKLDPEYRDAECNLGLALYHQHRFSEAAGCFERILSNSPGDDAALANIGMTHLAMQAYGEAASAYIKAIAVNPNRSAWHGNLGAAYMRLAQFAEAAECYRQASQLDPQNLNYHVSRGVALRAAGDLRGSIAVLEYALSVDSDLPAAIANLVVGLEYICDWTKLELYVPMLDLSTQNALQGGRVPEEDPMLNIRRSDDASLNRSVSRAWSEEIQSKAETIGKKFDHFNRPRHDDRITIGYLSYDYRNHPVAHQLYPLFRMHDRNRFRVVAISMGPDDSSFFRREIEKGSDEFVDIASQGLVAAAETIHDRRVDILIDLMGHSHHSRMGILALRPAPLQVSYLGFLSTTGAQYIDYTVADPVVVPREHNQYYEEKLLRLPHCYQLNHDLLVDKSTVVNRGDWGLPSDGFVFCCFNNPYKIDRSLFDAWMRILHQTPDSVLWLNGALPMASDNMRKRAEMLGVDSRRMIFANKLPLEAHLKRLVLADLALDTPRYNGGATTANTLSVGLPLITIKGRHWVSRMSASHLLAAGLPELIMNDLPSYEQVAIEFARHPEKLFSIRQRLEQNTKTHALFDTTAFVRTLETGFESIWHRYRQGLMPDHIDLSSRR